MTADTDSVKSTLSPHEQLAQAIYEELVAHVGTYALPDVADIIAHRVRPDPLRSDALAAVAHAAWHLMDDSGELDTADDNGRADFMHCGSDHDRLDLALDALESTGWDPHPEADQ